MKAKILPLEGKYYGTKILIDFEDGYDGEEIRFWNDGDFGPSVRELEKYNYTQEQWDKNDEVDNGWGGKTKIREMDLNCDSHFENHLTYERALRLVRLINSI